LANTNNPNGFKALKMPGGGVFPVFTGNTKSNLALTAGDALIMLTNGTLDIAVVGSTQIFGVCQSTVSAVAATRKAITYIPAIEGILWSAQWVKDSSAASPNWGTSYGLSGATGAQLLTNAASQGVARILMLEPALNNAAGAYNRVCFVWNKSQWSGQA
jgi:hypothetical protein